MEGQERSEVRELFDLHFSRVLTGAGYFGMSNPSLLPGLLEIKRARLGDYTFGEAEKILSNLDEISPEQFVTGLPLFLLFLSEEPDDSWSFDLFGSAFTFLRIDDSRRVIFDSLRRLNREECVALSIMLGTLIAKVAKVPEFSDALSAAVILKRIVLARGMKFEDESILTLKNKIAW